MIARAERDRLVDREELTNMLTKHPRRAGNGTLARVLGPGETIAFTRSEAEELLLTRIRSARLPMPRVNVRVQGFEVDFYWPAARLVVEVDGFTYHGSRAAFERDRRRDAILSAAGLWVIRVTWQELTTEPDAVLARIAQALVAR